MLKLLQMYEALGACCCLKPALRDRRRGESSSTAPAVAATEVASSAGDLTPFLPLSLSLPAAAACTEFSPLTAAPTADGGLLEESSPAGSTSVTPSTAFMEFEVVLAALEVEERRVLCFLLLAAVGVVFSAAAPAGAAADSQSAAISASVEDSLCAVEAVV